MNVLAFKVTMIMNLAIGGLLGTPLFAQTRIPVTVLESGHIIIKAKFNDIEGNFIFDTGGGITVITKKFATKVPGISRQDGTLTSYRATGERLEIELYSINSVSIGHYNCVNPSISIIDSEMGGFDGLISLNLFQDKPFTLDFINKLFIIETAKGLKKRRKHGRKISLQIQKDRDKAIDIFVYVVLNQNDTLQFCLDSGAGNDVIKINSRYLYTNDTSLKDSSHIKTVIRKSEFNPRVETKSYIAVASKLALKELPDIQKKSFKVSFTPDLIYDGIMSLDWLGNILTFSIKDDLLVISK